MAFAENETLTDLSLAVFPGSDVTELNFNWVTKYEPYDTLLEIAPAEENFASAKKTVTGESRKMAKYDTVDGGKVYWYSNKVTVSGLEPNTVYKYRAGDGDCWSEIKTVKTGSDKNVKSYVVTDVHIISSEVGKPLQESIDNWGETLALLNELDRADMILSLGDQVQNTGDTDYMEGFYNQDALSGYVLAPIDGNHDLSPMSNNPKAFSNVPNSQPNGAAWGIGDYYFKSGNVLFVMLSLTDVNFNNTNHGATFEAAIEAYPDYDWLVVGLHESIYGLYMYNQANIGSEDPETYHNRIYGSFISVIEEYEVDLVMTGHSHNYARSHFMKDGEIQTVEKNESGQFVDPSGTIWVNMSTSSRQAWAPGQSAKPGFPWSWLDFYYSATSGVSAFGVLETARNELTLSSYYMFEPETAIDSFTIVKTSIEYEEDSLPPPDTDSDKNNGGSGQSPATDDKNKTNPLVYVAAGVGAAALGVAGYAVYLFIKTKKTKQ